VLADAVSVFLFLLLQTFAHARSDGLAGLRGAETPRRALRTLRMRVCGVSGTAMAGRRSLFFFSVRVAPRAGSRVLYSSAPRGAPRGVVIVRMYRL
jgi:hypothetical protein